MPTTDRSFNEILQKFEYYFWIPIIGPIIGALLGAYLYKFVVGNVLANLNQLPSKISSRRNSEELKG